MSRIWRNDDYSTEHIEGGMLLYNNDDVMIFNETAAVIWEKIAKPIDVSDVITELAQEYDSPHEEIEELTSQLLKKLQEVGVVTIED